MTNADQDRYCIVNADNVCVRCGRRFVGRNAARIDEKRTKIKAKGALIPVDTGAGLYAPEDARIDWATGSTP